MPNHTAADLIGTLSIGDHVCWGYSSDDEHAAVLLAFLVAGLPADERLLYFGDDAQVARLHGALRDGGHDPDALIRTGKLVLGDAEAAYLPDGDFHPERCAEGFREVAHQAAADGFAGIRVAGENSAVLSRPEFLERWYEYEIRIELLTAAEPILGMCCFDRREHPDGVLAALDAVHRVALDPTGTAPRLEFAVHGRADGQLMLTGEVDSFSARQLRQVLEGPTRQLDPMVVDVSGLEFIDTAGMRVLDRMARARPAGYAPLVLTGATQHLRTLLPLVGSNPAPALVLAADT